MNRALSLPVRRALALAILLVLLRGAWSFVLLPVAAVPLRLRASADSLSERLEVLRAVAARRPLLARRSEALARNLSAQGGDWVGSSDELVVVSVENLVHQAATVAGGRIGTATEVGVHDDHGLHRVRVRFEISGTLVTLHRLLQTIGRTRPPLFVDRLTVSTLGTQASSGPPPLTIGIDVSAYRRAGGP